MYKLVKNLIILGYNLFGYKRYTKTKKKGFKMAVNKTNVWLSFCSEMLQQGDSTESVAFI